MKQQFYYVVYFLVYFSYERRIFNTVNTNRSKIQTPMEILFVGQFKAGQAGSIMILLLVCFKSVVILVEKLFSVHYIRTFYYHCLCRFTNVLLIKKGLTTLIKQNKQI